MNIIVTENPRQDGGITATNNLNILREYMDETPFFKKFVSEHGFELNPRHFTWEYHIKFNQRNGFIVLSEDSKDPDNLMFFLYPKGDEILTQPTGVCRVHDMELPMHKAYYKRSFEKLLKSLYKEFIQPNK